MCDPTFLTAGEGAYTFALYGDYIYYFDDALRRVPKTGGSGELVADIDFNGAGDLFIADDIAFISTGHLHAVPLNGGAPYEVANDDYDKDGVKIGDYVYFADSCNILRRVPVSGGDTEEVGIYQCTLYGALAVDPSLTNAFLVHGAEVRRINLATGGNGTQIALCGGVCEEIVANSHSLYWFNYQAGGMFHRVAHDGGPVEPIPTPVTGSTSELGGLAVDETQLYFMTHFRAIDDAITIYGGSPTAPIIPIYRGPGPDNYNVVSAVRVDDEYVYYYELGTGFFRIPK